MTRGVATGLSFAAAAALCVLLAEPALAVCSVFDRHPCAPTVCSVFSHHPCIPEVQYPLGQDLRLTIDSKADAPPAADERHALNTLRELSAALRACWVPPAMEDARSGMQVSVRINFKRNGEMFPAPRWTYTTPEASHETRKVYRNAIIAAFQRCTPLLLTKGLGGAIAGRPIAIRFVDNRTLAEPSR